MLLIKKPINSLIHPNQVIHFSSLSKWCNRNVFTNPAFTTTLTTRSNRLQYFTPINTLKKIEFVQKLLKLGFDHNEKIPTLPKVNSRVKIVLFSPQTSSKAVVEEVRKIIGRRRHIVTTSGIARYIPQVGANPSLGTVGSLEAVKEDRIESSIEHYNIKKLIHSVKKVHPYEEVGFDIFPYTSSSFRNNYNWLKGSFIDRKDKTPSDFLFSQNIKVCIAVENAHVNHLRTLIGKIGAGTIGNYSYCSFSYPVKMRMLLNERSSRVVEKKGELIETVASKNLFADLVNTLALDPQCKKAGIDIHPLLEVPQ